MENLTLALATEEDREAIWAVWHACALHPDTCWEEAYPTPALLAEDLTKGWLYVFLQDGHVVGSVSLPPADIIEKQGYPFEPCGPAVMLTRICVAPALWRHGLGGALLRLAEAQAARLGAGGLHILCDVRNTAGLALFASAGYQEVCRATLWGDHFSVREKRLTPARRFDRAGH